jgi:hypothetical protein
LLLVERIGMPLRQAFELLQREQILSPAHSLLNETWHLRQRRSLGTPRKGCSSVSSLAGDWVIAVPAVFLFQRRLQENSQDLWATQADSWILYK